MSAAASAVDVKIDGNMWVWAGYASNPNLTDISETNGAHGDRFNARQRTRVQIHFIADENLSALLSLENNIVWGDTDTGAGGPNNTYGALDADNSTFVVRRMHLDWTIPGTQVKTRTGVQGIAMPGFAFGNPVLDTDAAGLSVSAQFTPNVGLTAFWMRGYNGGNANNTDLNTYDELDALGVVLPVKTDVIRISPWGMVAAIGRDSNYYSNNVNIHPYSLNGRYANADFRKFDGTTYGYWAGLSLELPVIDPFFVKVDAIIGAVDTGDSDYDQDGWYVAADMGYKFSWGSVSAIGFYSSGDDDDDLGQMPVISANGGWNLSSGGLYGLAGASWRRYDGYLTSESGQGFWGLGVKIADVSFVNNLKHTLLGMYYGGTNDGDAVLRHARARALQGNMVNRSRNLATDDHAWEVTLINTYKVNDNLSLRFDIGYIQLELGDSWADKDDTKGNFISGIGVMYSF